MRADIAPAWLNLQQASRYCGLTERTLSTHLAQGAFESRLRGRRLINRESLDNWIRGGSSVPIPLQKRARKGGRR